MTSADGTSGDGATRDRAAQEAGQKRANRLAGELSPYLKLHVHNPVDWYPWGEEAIEKARREDKPIFLSVGYATCYWCHVMERESFSDAGTARLMNEHFVNIKVDREERPELDEIYMAATQIFHQQGGWPNSVFLTPDLRPFFAGTYFPPADMHGRPSFKTVLLSMHHAWSERRDDVYTQAEELAGGMQRMLEERGEPGPAAPSADVTERSKESLAARYDEEWGGFGSKPKFPTPSNLLLLADLADDGDTDAESMLSHTLDQMARGGIYDHLAGGFHRYATDRQWRVPHFEKMLYDNGLLLRAYARDYARSGDRERRLAALGIIDFLEAEMRSPTGAFYSAIDAEVGGREGAFHVWTLPELVEVLGEEDAGFLAPILGFDGPPFFDREYYILHRPASYAEQAEKRRMDEVELSRQVKALCNVLLEARQQRPAPLVDQKILTDWNGLAISGLATAGAYLADETALKLASGAAEMVLENLVDEEGILLHSWCEGEARFPAYLADYVFFVEGLLALHDADGDERWLRRAERLTAQQIERLEDPENGGFFTAGHSDDVLFRSKEVFDGAVPAANGVAAQNLLDLAERGDRDRWLPIAERTLRAFAVFVERQPEGARTLAAAVRRYHRLVDAPSAEEEAQATVMNLVEKAARATVDASARLDVDSVGEDSVDADSGDWRSFRLDLEIRSGWHLQAARSDSEDPARTRLQAIDGELRSVIYPEGELLDPGSAGGIESPRVYRGKITIHGQIRGSSRFRLGFQPCDERRCLMPITLELEAEEPTTH